jgi:hypothetical protein
LSGGANVSRPTSSWTTLYYGIVDLGAFYTSGSFRTTLVSNGYRNSSNQWTSLSAGGNTGASQIDLSPDGNIYFYGDSSKSNGSSSNPTLRMTLSPTGTLTLGSCSANTLISTVATGTAPLTVSSTTVVTNLNADLLDGLHGSSFLRSDNSNDTATGSIRTSGGVIEAGRTSGSIALSANDGYGNANVAFNHYAGVPDTTGSSGRIVCDVDSSTARFSFGLKNSTTSGAAVGLTEVMSMSESGVSIPGTLSVTGTLSGALSGNASTATTLQTTRTIWGQSFNGSGNVTGALSGATTISASSDISLGGELNFTTAGAKYVDFYTDNDAGTLSAVAFRLVNNASNSFHNGIVMQRGGAVSLYHNNSLKLATSASGTDVTGTLTAATFSGALLAASGSITTPGVASSGDTNTGLWWESADKLTVVAGGARAAYFNATEQINYGAIYITTADDVAADATTTTRDSGALYFRGKYWNGSTSANADWRIYNDMDGTGPNGVLRFTWLGTSKVAFDETGLVSATTFSGSGASLTSLNASNISSGTIGDAYLPATISSDITGNAATSTSTTTPTFVGDAVTRDDITTRIDTGFYETSTGTTAEGWPTNSGGYHHLISATHSNNSNYFALQIASRFDTQELYFRNTSGSGTQAWSTLLHSGNVSSYLTSLNASNLTSGTVPDARISGAYTGITAINGSGIGGTSGDWWTKIPLISGGGVLEIGRYIDFHSAAAGTTDFDVRIECTGSNAITFGTSTAVTAGTFTASSDIKLKKNIKTLTNSLEKVLSLRGVEYDRIDIEGHHIGVVAQEVEQIIPEVVSESNGTKSVAYANLVAVLIEAIKEQQEQINNLEHQLIELKK